METVVIKRPGDPKNKMIINRSDYNHEKHELWTEGKEEKKEEEKPVKPTAKR